VIINRVSNAYVTLSHIWLVLRWPPFGGGVDNLYMWLRLADEVLFQGVAVEFKSSVISQWALYG
jgi:hypothetical protein